MGGECWRRWGPVSASKSWGLDYECWEWAGAGAGWAADFLRGRSGRPSRVDIAWDFCVDDEDVPEDVAAAIREHLASRGISEGINSQDGVSTCYAGAPTSDRRVRIYRKDRQDGSYALLVGPVLRVELVLRRSVAAGWWAAWSADKADGMASAAAHLCEMTGLELGDVGEVPKLVLPDAADEAQRVLQFLHQHGPTIDVLRRAGVPVFELAAERVERGNRMMRSRCGRRLEALQGLDLDELVALVRQGLGGVA